MAFNPNAEFATIQTNEGSTFYVQDGVTYDEAYEVYTDPLPEYQSPSTGGGEDPANKDASGGYVGLTLLKINFLNALGTFTSFFTNSNTAARTYTFQDRNGTIADDTDLALKENSIDAATAKTTPADADTMGLIDSVASNVLKKVTWANIKATLKAYFDTLYQSISLATFTATGGTITTDGDYTVHTFTTSGTFTVSAGQRDIEYLVIGAGGGGGASNGGGGGGGGYRAGVKVDVKTSQFVTVGAGGAGAIWTGTPNGTIGGSSAFGDVVSLGGAGGRGENASLPASGGCGGGGSGLTATLTPSTGTLGQGFDGGAGSNTNNTGGGGGGAGGVGTAGNGTNGGNGGPGIASSITGSAVTRAGGGGGGVNTGATSAGTGTNGGGNGTKGGAGSAGTANTGGGGGGGGNAANGGQGGSGVVILRYLT